MSEEASPGSGVAKKFLEREKALPNETNLNWDESKARISLHTVSSKRGHGSPDDDLSLLHPDTEKQEHAQKKKQSPDSKTGTELSASVRQIQLKHKGTYWVELRVEVLGSDGKPNKGYNGGVVASLVFADEADPQRSNKKAISHDVVKRSRERAVRIASKVAVDGVAILHFSPPFDGNYSFSITCGGCKDKINTEKHYFVAGTHAALRIVTQPSGAKSGTVLEQQPAVQIQDRNGLPIHESIIVKATVVPHNGEDHEISSMPYWTLKTNKNGYARADGISVNRAGEHVIHFTATLWGDTVLHASSAPFEIVPGPAVASAFSLKPPSRVLVREPFSVVLSIVDSQGNETTNPPELYRGGTPLEVHLHAFDEAGKKVMLNGQATCTLCKEGNADSSATVDVVSVSRVHIYPLPLLVEPRTEDNSGGSLPKEGWGQLRISLKAEDWMLGAPQKPVWVAVRDISLFAPLSGLTPEDGAKYLRVEPTRLLFSVDAATAVQTFYVQPLVTLPLQPWSPGVVVGSEGLSQPLAGIFIAAFSITFDVFSDDPSWNSEAVVFDIPSPALLRGTGLIHNSGPKNVTVYTKDSDMYEVLASFPKQQLVREGEEVSKACDRSILKPLLSICWTRFRDIGAQYSVQPETLHFSAGNWQEEQTVVLKVDQDDFAPAENEFLLKGSVTGSALRTVLLRHELFSTEALNYWRMRGGAEVTFSVWDDDIAGVEWHTSTHELIEKDELKLAFRLRSRPLADVRLELLCEGMEVTSQDQKSLTRDNTSTHVDSSVSNELRRVTVAPTEWRTQRSFTLQLQNGIDESIGVLGDHQGDSVDHRRGLASRGFVIPLAVSRLPIQHEAWTVHEHPARISIVPCVGGQYFRAGNQTAECLSCPPGHECPDPREPPKRCPTDYMSLGGLVACFPCPRGFICPEGTAVPRQLKSGFYHGITQAGEDVADSSTVALPCPEGFYCVGGARPPEPCLPGYISGKEASECSACPAGFMCKTTRAVDIEPCPKGSYSLKGEETCRPCPAGFACASPQWRTPDDLLEVAYMEVACPTSSTREHCFVPFTVALPDNPTECVPCPAGHSCSKGAVERCPDFHYARLGDGLCRLCKGGYLCKGGADAPDEGELVPVGYYRSDHDTSAHPCPNGTLGLVAGATSVQSCSPCPAGYTCERTDNGGEYTRTVARSCPKGHVCIPDAVPCPVNTVQPNLGSTATECDVCMSGTYTRGSGQVNCIACPTGYYCITGVGPLPCRYSTTPGSFPIERLDMCSRQPGEFVVQKKERMFTNTDTCPDGSTHPDNLNDGTGLFSMESYASCLSCPAGYACPGGPVPTKAEKCVRSM
ncbi:hypothetical protein cyc_05223 [Cyclospora cayetanensis]|uniref:GCC2 and GCC3 domain-containing protein n=1 Tax=Cyclospora cayetanensis TaxID=88456 RepID=A0A1D3D169_9EIME|nr:hypothetical protein cyc_05223 [Cyclospora cayetanensis]